MKKIVLTGGGSAGHVIPNIILSKQLTQLGLEVVYIGSKNGMEQTIAENAGIQFFGISSGKLRRYFDLKNFSDPFKVLKGGLDAYRILRKIKPALVFSKGSFVSVPVVWASKCLSIPVVIHESDYTLGLANRLSYPACNTLCVSHEENITSSYPKAVWTQAIIDEQLFEGSKLRLTKQLQLDERPVILVMGGSQGSSFINTQLRKILPQLIQKFQILHITGKNNVDHHLSYHGYHQFEFVLDHMPDFYRCCDIAISRAGANSINELTSLFIPSLLIPLTKKSSRGDQMINAKHFKKKDFGLVLQEEEMDDAVFYSSILSLYKNRMYYSKQMKTSQFLDSKEKVLDIILRYIE